MPDEDLDANAESSTATDVAADAAQTQDASSASDATKTLADVVKETAAASTASQAKTEGETSETTEQAASGEEEETQPKSEVVDKKGDELLPFHKHQRFQELVKEKNEFKQKLETASEAVQRDANLNQYCQENGITNEEFVASMNIAALLHKDPTKALEALRGYVEALEVTVGNKLPADLQHEVEEGTLSEARAKEIAQLRVKSQGLEHTGKRTEEQIVAERQRTIATAVNGWDAQKRTSDPAYERKYPLIQKTFKALCVEKPPRNAAEGIALAEEAYKEVNTALGTLTPKPPVRKVLKTNGAATKSNVIEIKPGTPLRDGLKQIVQQVVAGARE